jgi:hypothetical protein
MCLVVERWRLLLCSVMKSIIMYLPLSRLYTIIKCALHLHRILFPLEVSLFFYLACLCPTFVHILFSNIKTWHSPILIIKIKCNLMINYTPFDGLNSIGIFGNTKSSIETNRHLNYLFLNNNIQ